MKIKHNLIIYKNLEDNDYIASASSISDLDNDNSVARELVVNLLVIDCQLSEVLYFDNLETYRCLVGR